MQAEAKLDVPVREVAAAMPAKDQFTANKLALDVQEAQELVQHCEIYRNQVNFQYWNAPARPSKPMMRLAARRNLYDAEKSAGTR